MPVGELLLTFKGAQDLYLTDNPKISYFKSVYKKYTSFSMETIELDLNANSSDVFTSGIENTDKKINFRIPRNGDLIHTIFLTVDIPDVFSTRDEQFQWIRRLGEYLIKSIIIKGGDSRVYSKITSEYLQFYAENYISKDKIDAYNEMIGNVPDMYDPANAQNNNGIYPINNANIPTIKGRKLMIPIPFWFCLSSGCALPLVAIQKMEFEIIVELRNTIQLYTIINNTVNSLSDATTTFRKRIRSPNTNNFFSTNIKNVASPLSVFGTYIFLDREERKKFALSEHEYLMTQYQYIENTGQTSSNISIDMLNINHPVRQLIVFTRFKYNEDANQWSNFTTWEYGPSGKLESPCNMNFSSQFIKSHYPSLSSNPEYYKHMDIVSDFVLELEGKEFRNGSNIEFYKYAQPYIYNKSLDSQNGIYSYSFALDNTKYQPSGSTNFSRINSKKIKLTKRSNLTNETNIIVIAENLNLFKVLGGMSGVAYVN